MFRLIARYHYHVFKPWNLTEDLSESLIKQMPSVSAPPKKRARTGKRTSAVAKTSFSRVPNPNSWTRVTRNVGFPNKMTMRHRYTEAISLGSVTGALATYSFSANGMFDSNITGTGHQPLYFDQMTAIYDHYTVIGSTIKVHFVSFPENTTPLIVGIMKNDDSTVTPANATAMAEQSGSVSTLLSEDPSMIRTLSCSYSAKGTYGGSVLGNDQLQGTSATNPPEALLYTIFAQSANVNSGSVYVYVEIEYLAVWDELRDIAQS